MHMHVHVHPHPLPQACVCGGLHSFKASAVHVRCVIWWHVVEAERERGRRSEEVRDSPLTSHQVSIALKSIAIHLRLGARKGEPRFHSKGNRNRLVWVEKQPKAADPIYIPEHIPEWENLSGQSIF